MTDFPKRRDAANGMFHISLRFRAIPDQLLKPTLRLAISDGHGLPQPSFRASDRASFALERDVNKHSERDQTGTKHIKINEADRYPAAHHGLVAGSSPDEASKNQCLSWRGTRQIGLAAPTPHQQSAAFRRVTYASPWVAPLPPGVGILTPDSGFEASWSSPPNRRF